MRSLVRLLAVALVTLGGVYACADSTTPSRQFAPRPAGFSRMFATDSNLQVSNVQYSDSGKVMRRLTPLATSLSSSKTIGALGGEIRIDAAGSMLTIPPGALATPTLITMTALAGPSVAYEFQPHGLTFALPVRVQQTIASTAASQQASLLNTAHGGYFTGTLDANFIDAAQTLVRLAEQELGYVETSATQLKFYIGHFSGYILTCGRD